MTTIANQRIKFGPVMMSPTRRITAEVRHDDSCRNGHNTFAVTCTTAELRGSGRGRGSWREDGGGAAHDLIVEHFPELADAIRFHLCSTDGPLHYVANTLYWARAAAGTSPWEHKEDRETCLRYARSTAIWPDATLDDLLDEEKLKARLPALLDEFRAVVEGLGLTY